MTGDDTGTTDGIDDYVTIKYDPDGNELWVQRYDGTGGGNDEAFSLVLDASGSVYVTGHSGGMTTVKYDTDGNQIWVATYGEADCFQIVENSISVDASGNVYVAGSTCVRSSDYITIKYDREGTQLWARTHNGSDDATDRAFGLGVDAVGNVYVTGAENELSEPLDAASNFATIKYNSSGDELWVRRYDGPGGSEDGAYSLALDALGNVYITGESIGIGTDLDYATVKYNADGVEQWVTRYNGPDVEGDETSNDKEDVATLVKVDAAGNVYVMGTSDGAGTERDYAIIKYGQPSPLVVAAGLDLTIFQGYGSLCVTLSAKASGGLPPYKYSWIPGQFTTQSIQVCPTKSISYAVTAMDAGQNKAMDEVKVNVIDVRCGKDLKKVLVCHKDKKQLCLIEAEVKEHLSHGDVLGACKTPPVASDNVESPGSLKLNVYTPSTFRVKNFPNPVSSTARIQYEVPFEGKLSISVYDVTGREVKTLVNGNINAGHHNTYFDASALKNGVYYYKALLQKGEKELKQTGKMIVIK